jgi:hypothetical protein
MFHACFSQREDSSIYCSRWDGTTWSRIIPALQLPEGETGLPSLAAGLNNELFLITGNGQGSLYFSRAKSSEAMTGSNWSTPTRLTLAHDGLVSSADVVVDPAGTVYVAYSVSLNEERGVYLVQSKDQGKTWSSPLLIFNEVKAETDFIGSPTLLVDMNGIVHIIWENQSIQVDGELQPRSLYYAHSGDGGLTFSDTELVVEAPLSWREIMMDSEGNLHILWQQQDMVTTIWDRVLMDGGRYGVTQQLSTGGGTSATALDAGGRLHLLSGSRLLVIGFGKRPLAGRRPTSMVNGFSRREPDWIGGGNNQPDGQMVVVQPVQTGEAGSNGSSTPPAISTFRQDNPRSQKVRMSCHRLQTPIELIQESPVKPAAVITSEPASNPVQIQFQQFGLTIVIHWLFWQGSITGCIAFTQCPGNSGCETARARSSVKGCVRPVTL